MPLSDKSGVNLKSFINQSNKSIVLDPKDLVKSSKLSINYGFYEKIWILQKYLKNPSLVKKISLFSP